MAVNISQADIWPTSSLPDRPSGRAWYWLSTICFSRSWVRQGARRRYT